MSYDSETTNIDEVQEHFQNVCFRSEQREWFYANVAKRGIDS